MEQIILDKLNRLERDILTIKIEIEDVKDILIDDECGLEVSDDVEKEIEESRNCDGRDMISHEEVMKRFVDGDS